MTDLERLLQALDARAALAAKGAQTTIDRLAKAAFDSMWRYLVANPGANARDAIKAAQAEFGGGFAKALAKAFSELLGRSVGVDEVRALQVGRITLSRRLYAHAGTTAAEVTALVREHAKGLLQARELSLRLYDGYNPQDGLRRPLEGAARGQLPKALRSLTADPKARRTLTALQIQGQKQAARLKTQALRAAYSEAFDAWEQGAGEAALRRKLEIAAREKNRFFANRIAQTELARAHQARVASELMDDDALTVVQVKLNPAHPRPDICDLHATANLFGLGPGCYPKELAPKPPFHPFCWCRLRPRFSLSAEDATANPGAAGAYLGSLGPKRAAEVMGSAQRAALVRAGRDVLSVVNAGQPAAYRTRRLSEAVSRQLEPEAP